MNAREYNPYPDIVASVRADPDVLTLRLTRAVAERIREVLFGCAQPAVWEAFNRQMPAPMKPFHRATLPPGTRGVDPDGPDHNKQLPRNYKQRIAP